MLSLTSSVQNEDSERVYFRKQFEGHEEAMKAAGAAFKAAARRYKLLFRTEMGA